MSSDQSSFDTNTLSMLNRIANNRRTGLQLEQPARLSSQQPAKYSPSKQHALFGAPDGMRRASATEAPPHRPGTANAHERRAGPVAARPASAAQRDMRPDGGGGGSRGGSRDGSRDASPTARRGNGATSADAPLAPEPAVEMHHCRAPAEKLSDPERRESKLTD